MEVTEALVRHVARLARLELTEAEVPRLVRDLSRILAHVDALARADVAPAPATALGDPVPVSALRPDVPAPGLTRAEALANAPDQDGVFFRVPRVLEGE
jgi:aspartyl-tRNA(Asn)/glutamyl-tRNA(Gln) amidotransferase subunit C